MQTQKIEEALSNLSELRRVVERLKKAPSTHSLATRALLQLGAGVASGVFLVSEISSRAQTEAFLLSAENPTFRTSGLIGLSAGLVVLTILACVVLYHGARQDNEEWSAYVERNFRGVNLLSFCSDLFVKFVAIAAVVLALHPQFVAPLLFVFIGDYLYQGRLFTFSLPLSAVLGSFAIVAGAVQFWMGTPSLQYALMLFTALSFAAAALSLREKSRISNSMESE